MPKWISVVSAGVILIVVVRPVYILGAVLGLWQPLTRPASVSLAARYVSRIEDGIWFDCVVDTKRNVNVCKAWDDKGHLIADGDFRLKGENRAATQAELRPSAVMSGDGHAYMIYLFGNQGAHSKVLIPVRTYTGR